MLHSILPMMSDNDDNNDVNDNDDDDYYDDDTTYCIFFFQTSLPEMKTEHIMSSDDYYNKIAQYSEQGYKPVKVITHRKSQITHHISHTTHYKLRITHDEHELHGTHHKYEKSLMKHHTPMHTKKIAHYALRST